MEPEQLQLSEGKRLFPHGAGLQAMRLLDSKRYDSGVVFLRYAPQCDAT
jgi:hypothetical protein